MAIYFRSRGVLIDWNPASVLTNFFKEQEEKKRHFFENICTADWNEQQDAGRTLAAATQKLLGKHPGLGRVH